MSLLFRLVITLATLLVAALGLFELTGRVLAPRAAALVPAVNRALDGAGVELESLAMDWHLLNPVVRIGGLEFPGGRAAEVAFELDVLESIVRNRFVARALAARGVTMTLVEDASGRWRPAGGDGSGEVPAGFEALLEESDSLRLEDAELVLESAAGARERLRVTATAANRGGGHRARVSLAMPDCPEPRGCRLDLGFAVTDRLLGRGMDGTVHVTGRRFTIGPALARLTRALPLEVAAASLSWRVDGRDGLGRGTLDLRAVDTGHGTVDRVRLAAQARATSDFEAGQVAVSNLRLTVAEATLAPSPVRLAWQRGETPSVTFAVDSLGVSGLVSIVTGAAARHERVTRWLTHLDPEGRITGVTGRLDPNGLAVAGVLTGGTMEPYQGVPLVRGAAGRFWATERSVAVELDAHGAEVGFVDVFDSVEHYDSVRGRLRFAFAPGYLGLTGEDLIVTAGDAVVHGELGLARPDDPYEQRMGLLARGRDIDVAMGRRFVPRDLPGQLSEWIDSAVRSGHAPRVLIAYHGHLKTIADLPMRHAGMRLTVEDATLAYHPDWPAAEGLDATLEVNHDDVRAEISAAGSLGVRFTGVELYTERGSDYIELSGHGAADGAAATRYLFASPLAGWLPYVGPDWSLAGALTFDADLGIPIRDSAPELAIDVDLALDDTTLDMPDLALEVAHLDGELRYLHPYRVTAEHLDGRLFGEPADLAVTSDDDGIDIHARSRASVAAVAEWLDLTADGIASGVFGYDATLGLDRSGGAPARLAVYSDLSDVEVTLPGSLAKVRGETRETDVSYTFGEGPDRLSVSYGTVASGWLTFDGSGVARGGIGIDAPAPTPAEVSEGVAMTGWLDDFDLAALPMSGGGAGPSWTLSDFQIGRLNIGGVTLDEVTLNGRVGDDLFISLHSRQAHGTLSQRGNEPLALDIDALHLDGYDGEGGDPMAGVDVSEVPPLDVNIDAVTVNGDDYGSWRFELRQTASAVELRDLTANLRGLKIVSLGGVRWQREGEPHSTFAGQVTGDDLAGVLAAWGYAPNVESESFGLDGEVTWPGSPLNFDLGHLSGHLSGTVSNGRFLDVDANSGAVRIVGLLNFTAIAKRITLDFSDVFGKGISFNSVTASASLEDGLMRFTEPMTVSGTGSRFKIDGTVHLGTGALDNEMVVTLPVNKSLPWYAAYVALFANPLAGVGVLVGERVFRDQIQQVSSAKYSVDGTIENPIVSFERVFADADDMANPPEDAAASGAQDAGEPSREPPRSEEHLVENDSGSGS